MNKGEIIFCMVATVIVIFLLMREYIKDDIKAAFKTLAEMETNRARLAQTQSRAEKSKKLLDDQVRETAREIKGFGLA